MLNISYRRWLMTRSSQDKQDRPCYYVCRAPLALTSTMTLAVFTSVGLSNPDQAWVRAMKDERGNDPAVVVT
jgi:hypothetical protein